MGIERRQFGYTLNSVSQAEILRSHQKDNDFVKYLREKLLDILHDFGKRRLLLHFIHSNIPVSLVYFIVTTAMGNQTLGEEYTGIVQANFEKCQVPSLRARVFAMILECFGEKMFIKLLGKLEVSVNNSHDVLTPTAYSFLLTFISKLRSMIPIIIIIHKGLFYIHGRYYSLGKRIAQIDYAKVYGSHPTGISWGLKLLGIATLAQCILKIYQTESVETNIERYVVVDEKKICQICQLCLEQTPTTATPCGHLFCWSCLCDWLRTKTQCPVCREFVTPSRIVYLMNL